MSNAKRDQNNIPTLLGTLDTDGKTTIPLVAEPTLHAIFINNGASGTDYGPQNAPRDENSIPVLMAVSSVDGVTPVVVYASSNGYLLVDNT